MEQRRTFRFPPQNFARFVSFYAAIGAKGEMRPGSEKFDGFFDGPLGRASAQTKHSADGLDRCLHRGLAILHVEQGAGGRPFEGQKIKVNDIRDVDMRPDVETAADVAGHTGLLRLLDEPRDLNAAGIYPNATAVDERRADDDRPNA